MASAITMANTRPAKNGLISRSKPMAIPVKAECPMASEKKDIFFRTTKIPKTAMSTPKIMPTMRARWKNGRVMSSSIGVSSVLRDDGDSAECWLHTSYQSRL